MKFHRVIYLCILVFLSNTITLFAENESLDDEYWRKATKDLNYLSQEQSTKKTAELTKSEPSSSFDLPFSGMLKYLVYGLVIILLVSLLVIMVSNANRNPPINNKLPDIDNIKDVEERIHEVDLEAMLQQALNEEKFEIALRLSYLIIVRNLSRAGLISWAVQKTNWEYYHELRNESLKNAFAEITNQFEKVWYGDKKLRSVDFFALDAHFSTFKNELSSNKHE